MVCKAMTLTFDLELEKWCAPSLGGGPYQTWHDDGPPPRDGAHHFSRSRSKVKVIAYVYILSYSPHHWTDHDQTWHDDGPPPRDGAHHFSSSRSKVKVIALHTIFQGQGQRSRS